MRGRTLRLGFLLLALSAPMFVELKAETYIVPIWADGLVGTDGKWWSQATIVNPNDFPVTVQVTRVFPLVTEECPLCDGGADAVLTVQPHATRFVRPSSLQAGKRLIAGAFEMQSSAPVSIRLVAYGPGQPEIRQRLVAAREWLEPGLHSISSVEYAPKDVRVNVFIVNPNDTPMELSLWIHERAENEIRISVPPRGMRSVVMPTPICDSAPCGAPIVFPPEPQRIELESDGECFAFASSVAKSWAIFSLPDASVN